MPDAWVQANGLKKKTHKKSYLIKVRTTTVEKRKCNVGRKSGLNWGSQPHNLPPIWSVREVWINKPFICCAEICCRICSMLCLDLKDSAKDAGSSTEKQSQSLCVHSYERVPCLPSFLERHEAVWRPGEVNVNCLTCSCVQKHIPVIWNDLFGTIPSQVALIFWSFLSLFSCYCNRDADYRHKPKDKIL